MSKEYLEALEKIKQEFNCDPEYYGLGSAFEILESALKRLESIDNANPSEALKELDKIIEHLKIGWTEGKYLDLDICFNNIKATLLKSQEPKQYVDELKLVEKKLKSLDLLMQELDCKDFADLRKYARCGYEKLQKTGIEIGDEEIEVEE